MLQNRKKRTRIILRGLLVLGLMICFALSLKFYITSREEKITQNICNSTYQLSLKLNSCVVRFLAFGTNNPEFFQSGECVFINDYRTVFSLIENNIRLLDQYDSLVADNFKGLLGKYDNTFNQVVNLTYEAGSESTGLQGKLLNTELTHQTGRWGFQYSIIKSRLDSVQIVLNNPEYGLKSQLLNYHEKLIASSGTMLINADRRQGIANSKSHLAILIFFIILLLFVVAEILHRKDTNRQIKNSLIGNTVGDLTLRSQSTFSSNEMLQLIEEKDFELGILQMEKEQLKNLLADLPLCIYETDLLGNFTYVNTCWLERFGYTENDIEAGLNLIETLHQTKANYDIEKVCNAKEFIAVCKDGTCFNVVIHSKKVCIGNTTAGYRGIIIDYSLQKKYLETLRKEKIKAEKSDYLKSAFLANMSHEIRTPMNAIIGFSNLLLQNGLNEDERLDYVTSILNSGEVLLNLINDIVDIAKIEANELRINLASCDLHKIMEDLYASFFAQIKKTERTNKIDLIQSRGIKVEELPLVTDSFRLRQILSNLITNSLKFTTEGEIEFGYKVINKKGKAFLEFRVRDTGIGIDKNQQKLIFERFRQVDSSSTRNFGGAGLGLAISMNLVDLLGGNIWVNSEKGKGAIFYFTIPYETGSSLPSDVILKLDNEANFDWHSKTILLVEDQISNYKYFKAALRETKATIIWVKNGEDAVKICAQNHAIDLVLMDIKLPEIDGFEATKRIKHIRPELLIISQTAFAGETNKEKCLNSGFDDFIEKPISPKALIQLLAQHLTLDIKNNRNELMHIN